MLQTRNRTNGPLVYSIGIGDAEIVIYSWVVYPVLCQIINMFGIATNIINIICFVKQGFQDPVNISLLGLSVSDLASITTLVLTCIFVPCSLSSANLPFEPLEVSYMISATPHFAFTRISSCITAMITFERCLSIAAPLKVKGIITPERTSFTIIAIFISLTISSAPIYVANRLGAFFSPTKNMTTYGFVYRDPENEMDQITLLVNNFIVPFGAFIIIGTCTVILSVQLRLKSEWRKTNVASEQADRVSSRNQKVAKMVLLISVLYITCFVPTSIIMLAVAFEPALFMRGKYINISIVLCGIVYILEGVNSSMNIFIYHHMSSKYRDTFNKLFVQEKSAKARS